MERLVAVVVDEAHCVKTWGDEFRTAFAHIGELRSLIPSRVNILALTANQGKLFLCYIYLASVPGLPRCARVFNCAGEENIENGEGLG